MDKDTDELLRCPTYQNATFLLFREDDDIGKQIEWAICCECEAVVIVPHLRVEGSGR